MTIQEFLEQLNTRPLSLSFSQLMTLIDSQYQYEPTSFSNGKVLNNAGQNEGSCKLFAFAKLHQLTPEQTLQCFGEYYRDDVLNNPDGNDHANIRNFIKYGWQGVEFLSAPLSERV